MMIEGFTFFHFGSFRRTFKTLVVDKPLYFFNAIHKVVNRRKKSKRNGRIVTQKTGLNIDLKPPNYQESSQLCMACNKRETLISNMGLLIGIVVVCSSW
jgi:hypothetical protein